MQHLRNFAIIAHIDHGKSTLSDALMRLCSAVDPRLMTDQLLDSMSIERERGITIKAQTVCLKYVQDATTYTLNFMDTPGHVDFGYEVSRCLSACEGSLLVIDASQGIEAQTLANVYKAMEHNHVIIPVLNKVDLPAADPEGVTQQIQEVLGLTQAPLLVSAKTGQGIEDVLRAVVNYIPAPVGQQHQPLKAILVDSWYDTYLGVVILVRVIDGVLTKGMPLRMMATGGLYTVEHVGVFTPKKVKVAALHPGEVGYVVANIRAVSDCQVGDTITHDKKPTAQALPGFKPSTPVVFCGLFPVNQGDFPMLKESLAKLKLNDASFGYEMETSLALGMGFRCGFLGLLHLEIIQERLRREFSLDLVTTAPSVSYYVYMRQKGGGVKEVLLHSPADMPCASQVDAIHEPWIKATIFLPSTYVGSVIDLCQKARGIQEDLQYVTDQRVMLTYRLPLNEVIFSFYDRLKSCTSGYASFDYEPAGYHPADLVVLNILVHGRAVDALSSLAHRSQAQGRGRALCEKLKELIPPCQFAIPIQAAIGGKIIARETVSAFRKDVTAKLYGGDVTRKNKLLDKQKKGKKLMAQQGSVDISPKIYIQALKTS